MDNLLALLLLSFAKTGGSSTEESMILCDGVIFRDAYYDSKLMFSGFGKPYNMVVHDRSGILFFSHTTGIGENVDFDIMACYLKHKYCFKVDVPGGYAITYDPKNNNIFFGGHDGIYQYNHQSTSVKFWGAKNVSIWSLYLRSEKRLFFYIEYPSQKLYVYTKNVGFKIAPGFEDIEVECFFLSKIYAMYYSNKTGLYKKKPSHS